MKRFLAILTIFCLVQVLWAVPAERTRLKVVLTDGTELTVTSYGDEHYSWLLADDGEVIAPADNLKGRYIRTGLRQADARQEAARCRAAVRRIGSQETAPLPAAGTPKVPVVLVNFQDSVFHVGKTDEDIRAYYDLYCNGTRDGQRYTAHGSYGSIRDYFAGQSDSLFQPEFVVIGPVTLDHPVATYGSNNGSTKDTGYSKFRKEVIQKATAAYEGDWSDFDNKGNGNGNVDIVFFIFAGCGENTVQTNPELIWPKESKATEEVTLDDGRVLRFATSGCCPENRRKAWAEDGVTVASVAPDGIGVMCHELSHALGLPDFYDTGYRAFGMDVWSLMDYGCYMQNGCAPVAYTAYERDFMGWRKLQTITEAGPYTLYPIASEEGVGLKVVNPENENEYYVLEARLAAGWDAALARYGHGMQVTHVDYNAPSWNSNSVNVTPSHQRMTIIAANNNYNGTTTNADPREAWAGNLYPFGENDSLTAHSVPAATVFSAKGYMAHDLTRIRIAEDGQSVSFMLDEGLYDAVRALPEQGGDAAAQSCFDLSGRPVAVPTRPGFYLLGGRKVIIR